MTIRSLSRTFLIDQLTTLVRKKTTAIQPARCAMLFTTVSTGRCTSNNRSAIQPADAKAANSAPPILTDE